MILNRGDLIKRFDGAIFKIHHVIYEEEITTPYVYAVHKMNPPDRKISLVYIYPGVLDKPSGFQLISITGTELENQYRLMEF